LIEEKKKTEGISLGSKLRRVQTMPSNWLSHQLGIEFEIARLIQNLIRDFLSGQEEESENPDRPIFFHRSGCQCRWCKLG